MKLHKRIFYKFIKSLCNVKTFVTIQPNIIYDCKKLTQVSCSSNI